MTLNDGFQKWRENDALKLEQLVQKRIEFLQNPENCSTAKILKCEINDFECGWGECGILNIENSNLNQILIRFQILLNF